MKAVKGKIIEEKAKSKSMLPPENIYVVCPPNPTPPLAIRPPEIGCTMILTARRY